MTRSTYSNQRGITLRSGHVTSVRLEPEFWHALRRIAYQQNMSLQALLGFIEVQPRSKDQPFASALRCYAIKAMLPYFPIYQRSPTPNSRNARTSLR
jgi:predicted DNA-binding ribbon-helix-helix protein